MSNIFKSLVSLYDSRPEEMCKFNYAPNPVWFCIVINKKGKVVNIEDLNGTVLSLPIHAQGTLRNASPETCHFALGGISHVLGKRAKNKTGVDQPVHNQHWKCLNLAFVDFVESEELLAYKNMLESEALQDIVEDARFYSTKSENPWVVFRLLGSQTYIHESSEAIMALEEEYEHRVLSKKEDKIVCSISGNSGVPATLIRSASSRNGLTGNLVTYNCSYSESFTQGKASSNHGFSVETAHKIPSALEWLYSNKHYQHVVEGTNLLYWVDKNIEENFDIDLFSDVCYNTHDQKTEQTKKDITAMNKHALLPGEADFGVNVLMLQLSSAGDGRDKIRFFEKASYRELEKNIEKFRQDVESCGLTTKNKFFPNTIVKSCVIKSEKLESKLIVGLVESVIFGQNYDARLLPLLVESAKLSTVRKEPSWKGRLRAISIGAILNRNMKMKNIEEEVGFKLGRLVYLLGMIQEQAYNSTKIMNNLGAFAATPLKTIPREVLSLGKYKSKFTSSGTEWIYYEAERIIKELILEIGPIPEKLDITQQGLFMIGLAKQENSWNSWYNASSNASSNQTENSTEQ